MDEVSVGNVIELQTIIKIINESPYNDNCKKSLICYMNCLVDFCNHKNKKLIHTGDCAGEDLSNGDEDDMIFDSTSSDDEKWDH